MTASSGDDHGAGWWPVRRWRVDVIPSVDAEATSLAAIEVASTPEVGPGPIVLLAHGAGSSARFVADAFAAPLAAAGYRLVTYDLRGHAGSSPARSSADHHLDVHAADLAAVVASMDNDVAVIGGVSLGAHAAVRAVARLGVSASAVLACVPAWLGHATPGAGPHAAVAAELFTHGLDGMLARLRVDSTLPTWLRDTLLTDYPRHDAASLTAVLAALDGGEAPAADELRGVRAPVAVVGWADDPGHPLEVARQWAEHVERGRLATLDLAAMATSVTALGAVAVEALVDVTWPIR